MVDLELALEKKIQKKLKGRRLEKMELSLAVSAAAKSIMSHIAWGHGVKITELSIRPGAEDLYRVVTHPEQKTVETAGDCLKMLHTHLASSVGRGIFARSSLQNNNISGLEYLTDDDGEREKVHNICKQLLRMGYSDTMVSSLSKGLDQDGHYTWIATKEAKVVGNVLRGNLKLFQMIVESLLDTKVMSGDAFYRLFDNPVRSERKSSPTIN